MLRAIAAGAVEWWQVADVRFTSTETAITSGLLLCFSGFAAARRRGSQLALLLGVGILFGGLILTKSRGFWVAGALGLVVAFAMSDGAARRRLLLGSALGMGVLVSVALLFFSEQVGLLAIGTLNRLATLSDAATGDISLLNRYIETSAAWDMILENPVLGYGWGVQVVRYDIISEATIRWSFLHNGYVALWFKTGLWGLALMMIVWVGAILRSTLVARSQSLTPAQRACAVGFASSLIAFSLSALTSNPFAITDQMLIVTMLMAGAHGLADRARWSQEAARSPGDT
jgi:O-antigen ligase